MAIRVPARLTAQEGRRFGLTVGTAFLVLAVVTWWREHPLAMTMLGSIGGVLAIAGLVIPTHLGPVERSWMALAHVISRITTPIVMAAMYFVVLTPVGWLRRLFSENPMVHRATPTGFWKPRAANARRSASMERQF